MMEIATPPRPNDPPDDDIRPENLKPQRLLASTLTGDDLRITPLDREAGVTLEGIEHVEDGVPVVSYRVRTAIAACLHAQRETPELAFDLEILQILLSERFERTRAPTKSL